MRTIKSLATETGISERQFHRRLDAKDEGAMLKLRQEILHDWGAHFQTLCSDLGETSDLLRRCNPDLADNMSDLAGSIRTLLDKTPHSEWWSNIEKRQSEALDDDEMWAALEREIEANTIRR